MFSCVNSNLTSKGPHASFFLSRGVQKALPVSRAVVDRVSDLGTFLYTK